MNKFKKKIEPKKTSSIKGEKLVRPFLSVVNGNFLIKGESPKKILGVLIFLMFIAILYIANIHYAEKIIKDTQKAKNELKELRSEYIAVKSRLMYKSKQSEVALSVKNMGLKESIVPPIKIIVE